MSTLSVADVVKNLLPNNSVLYPEQTRAIDLLVSGNNTLCLFPTGGGKSLVYQVAGLARGGLTVVISPLLALMNQHAEFLQKRGYRVLALHRISASKSYYQAIRSLVTEQKPEFLFISPERQLTDGYLEYVLQTIRKEIGLIAVDEAHCVSQWGDSFRPSYKFILESCDRIFAGYKTPPIVCLTATLNHKEQDDIIKEFRIEPNHIVRSQNLWRTNLNMHLHELPKGMKEDSKHELLEKLLRNHLDEKVIVYCHRKSNKKHGTKALFEKFTGLGFHCDYFDADRSDTDKDSVMHRFELGDLKIVFATSAFGMGIDIKDIRVVIHYQLPESIEQYYQEVGRSGRDGKPADCYLIFSRKNVDVLKQMIGDSLPTAERIVEIYNELTGRTPDEVCANDVWGDTEEKRLLFFYLMQFKLVKLHAKGFGKVDCFDPAPEIEPQFTQMVQAAKNAQVPSIAKKYKSVEVIEQELFEWLRTGKLSIKNNNTPSKFVFYTCASILKEDDVSKIILDIEEKIGSRLAGFQLFVDSLVDEKTLATAIHHHLGI